MCYDISFKAKVTQLIDYFPDLIFDSQVEINFGNMAHIQGVGVFATHPIIYRHRDDGKLHCRPMEWSCIEFYAKAEPDIQRRNSMLNIRSERILDDAKSYWYKIRNRRCLVPVSGIFEHRKIEGWKKKVPYHVSLKEQEIFFLPGLYSVVELPDKETGEMMRRFSFGIITRGANSVMQQIHNDGDNSGRMPLFLPLEMARQFLNDELDEPAYRQLLNFEMPSNQLDYHTVNTIRTLKPREDEKEKHEPWEWPMLPPLQC